MGGKLTNGLIRNGHHVINFSYRDVARAGGWFGSRRWGKTYLFGALKEFMLSCRPDILLLGHGYMITPDVIADIRQALPGLVVIQWNSDALFVEENAKDFAARHAVVDASFISTSGPMVRELIGSKGQAGFLPNPVDWSVERGKVHERREVAADVFYACGNPARKRVICGEAWEMNSFCHTLEERLPSSVTFSYAGVCGQPYCSGADYAELLENAAMGLNISRRADYPLYSSDRLAHMIGSGQLILMERKTGYDQFFADNEMAFFSSVNELVDHIDVYHHHPTERQRVAKAGWQRYHHLFNERRVADYIIHHALGEGGDNRAFWDALSL